MPSPVRLRVHFAAQGFGADRLVKPMLALRADVAIILTISKTDEAKGFLTRCVRDLEAAHVGVEVVECNLWRVSSVVDTVGSIVNASPQHEYFFNVSTGSKTACIAGTIAGMLWKVIPYYQQVDYRGKADERKEDYAISGEPQIIPTFETKGLEAADLKALDFISTRGGSTPKKVLLAELRGSGDIRPKRENKVTAQALYGQLNSILGRLDAWGLVEQRGRGRGSQVDLTDAGKEGALMFAHRGKTEKPLRQLK